jgi:glycosyltransferase involved in cell wall biosynthesis
MSRPLVSVVIPAYNYGHYVTEAVDSVLAQTYPNVEIIVVDDGSTDETPDRLKPYLGKIVYIRQENQGLSAARNTGIRHARGEWIGLLDADDLWHPGKLEVQLAAADKFGPAGLVGSPVAQQMPERLAADPPVKRLTVADFLTSTPLTSSSALIRRGCLERVGLFDTSLRSVEDRDMWLRVAAEFPALQVISPCWTYRLHPGQMNRHPRRMRLSYSLVLARFFRQHPQWRRLESAAWSYLYLDAAQCHLEAGNRSHALVFLGRSLLRRPWMLPLKRPWFRLKMMTRLILGESAFHVLKPRKPVV